MRPLISICYFIGVFAAEQYLAFKRKQFAKKHNDFFCWLDNIALRSEQATDLESIRYFFKRVVVFRTNFPASYWATFFIELKHSLPETFAREEANLRKIYTLTKDFGEPDTSSSVVYVHKEGDKINAKRFYFAYHDTLISITELNASGYSPFTASIFAAIQNHFLFVSKLITQTTTHLKSGRCIFFVKENRLRRDS